MLDRLSLDQLRTFIAAADEGSFSAAGRKLNRAQSMVSQTLSNLEAQTGVLLFERTGRYPVLTEVGRALLADARLAVGAMDQFKARAKGLAGGLEPELSIVIDVLFPIKVVTVAVAAFQSTFPSTPLRLYVEALGAVIAPVLDGRCAFAVAGSLPTVPSGLVRERLRSVMMCMVASPLHPFAIYGRPIPAAMLAEHVQLVLTDRTTLSKDRDFGVFTAKTWRLADLGAKHAFLRSGLGWGGMPLDLVAGDLESGELVRIELEELTQSGLALQMSALYPTDRPPGPAGRWMIDHLKDQVAKP
jgi:DNA-binding transcriptional LysR family regulator